LELAGGSSAGVFYGIQTLKQTVPSDPAEAYVLPSLEIVDRPAFPYRGMHLDVSRHFFDVAFIKKHLDAMAQAKMNTFHWHLTDDQGWRIEIKHYPRLTDVGAWRSGSQQGPYSLQNFDTLRYGGFYTQDQIREVVAYAAERHITVVPEIEMPGHALAALAAYPQFSCNQKPLEVARGWGVFDDVFCAGNDETFVFLENVLREVFALFPSPYVHIGGDECPKTRWKSCARCQARMQAEGLKDEHELQSYFIQRMERFANANGRKIIGWDEILEGGLAPNATVMSWRGESGGKAAAQSGHDAIMTPGKPCYFDHYQAKPDGEPHAIGGFNPVQAVYLYPVVPAGLSPEEATHILGSQGNVWTEYMLTPDHVEYMMHPRMEALAEVLWTGPRKESDVADFRRRLRTYVQHLEQSGYRVAPHFFDNEPLAKP
jgi:hexosaminidase